MTNSVDISDIDINELKLFITDLITKSANIAKKYFRANFSTTTKNDKSPVTQADEEIELFLREAIAKKYPAHVICGEEGGYELGENSTKAKYKWFIDPIDGTTSFIAGRPLFTTLIGFAIDEKPAIGFVFQPITGELWIGESYNSVHSASLNGEPIKVSKTGKIDEAKIATTSPDLFGIGGYGIFSKAKEKAAITVFGGDAYNYMMLAMGNLDAVIEEGLKPHDYCAIIPVILGAGGVVKNFEGETLDVKIVQSLIGTATEPLYETIKSYGE